MRWPWHVPKLYVSHSTEPYAFEPGRKYVIELDRKQVTMDQVRELDGFFQENGIIVKLMLTVNGNSINPVTATKRTEERVA